MSPQPTPSVSGADTGLSAQVVVIGSGAGGAVTALTLAERGYQVLLLEEGGRVPTEQYGADAVESLRLFYRHRGMSPIIGTVPIGYVEGCCYGGSTEINSGFWHRAPRETLARWQQKYDVRDALQTDLAPYFEWAERTTGISTMGRARWPPSSVRLAAGAEAMGWAPEEVSRSAVGCQQTNRCAGGCPTGAKRGMSRSLLPMAEANGVRILTNARSLYLLRRRSRITGVVARVRDGDGEEELVQIDADAVFVCCGATETPALLQRSGLRLQIGHTLSIHPMLKVMARFPEPVDADRTVLPVVQVKEFASNTSFGGAYFSPGHAAMTLGENWNEVGHVMSELPNLASYYVAVRGTGQGSVRSGWGLSRPRLRYELSFADHRRLSDGLGRLSALLLAAGATAIYPAVHGLARIESEKEAVQWLDELLPRSAMSLTTVHAFSSCPMGENRSRCAADSHGRVHGVDNLYVNDASMLPDSPGTNPQATIMALARRNALHFAERPSR